MDNYVLLKVYVGFRMGFMVLRVMTLPHTIENHGHFQFKWKKKENLSNLRYKFGRIVDIVAIGTSNSLTHLCLRGLGYRGRL